MLTLAVWSDLLFVDRTLYGISRASIGFEKQLDRRVIIIKEPERAGEPKGETS